MNINENNLSPFVKWVGGKRNVIKKYLKDFFPINFKTYIEPFVGAGAVFFYLKPKKAIINDINKELMITYNVIKDNKDLLIKELEKYQKQHSKEFFYDLRKKQFKNKIKIAARFIYLNKSCFNGMYRVNKNNEFNVPFNGKLSEKLNLFDSKNLNNISDFLQKNNISILNNDFEYVLKKSRKGDFIFCDPPYDYENKNGFDSYTKNSFGQEGQIRLAHCLIDLDKKGVKWMLTNHNTSLIQSLYKKFQIIPIVTNRSINSKGSKRKNSGKEVVIINYEK